MTLAVFAPLVMSLLAALFGPALGRRVGYLAVLGFLPALGLALRLPEVRAGTFISETLPWVPGLGLSLTFLGEGFSVLFAVLIGAMGVLASLYAVAYLYSHENFGRFFCYLLLFGASMLGLVLSDNLIALFGFWELTSISSFLLIGLWHQRGAARDGAQKAFLISAGGGLGLLAAVAMLIQAGGSVNLSGLDLEAVRASPLFVPAMLLALLAAFTKSAQLPFHLWLPTAMEAPTPVSAFLHSATMVKAGVVLVAKLGFVFGGPLWAAIVVPVGLATMFWGSYLALRQDDLKALLAYSTVSQLGLLMSLYGLSSQTGAFAATAHLLNHAAFKAALFFVVGVVDHACKTREISRLGGLARVMPVTAALAVVGALSMAGLPPFGGFVSKELFYEAMIAAGPLFIAVAVAGSVLTFAYSLRFLTVFFGPLRHPAGAKPQEPGAGMLLPAGLLAGGALLFGLWPYAAQWLTYAAGFSFNFAGSGQYLSLWHGVNLALILSVLTWALGTLVFLARRRVNALQDRLEPGWNNNTVYYALLEGSKRGAVRAITATQGLPLPDQLRLMLLAMVGIGTLGVLPMLDRLPPPRWEGIGLEILPVAALLLAGAAGVLLARDRITAIIVTGLTGFGSAAAFLLLRAPDLALTQLLVEAVTVILFLLAFRYLPSAGDRPREGGRGYLDAGLAALAGVGTSLLVLATTRPFGPAISDYFLANSYELGGGKNAVNVILVDFRGFDTLGEVAVVGMVAVIVWGVVRLGRGRALPPPGRSPPPGERAAKENAHD